MSTRRSTTPWSPATRHWPRPPHCCTSTPRSLGCAACCSVQPCRPARGPDSGRSAPSPLVLSATVEREKLSSGPFALGGAPLGGLFNQVSPEDAFACLQAAWEAGVRYFDTAPHYGAGLSEQRIGAFLASKPSAEWTLSTKVGRILEHSEVPDDAGFEGEKGVARRFDFSRDGILRSFSDSLERLGTSIDGVFLHDPDDYERQALDEAWPVLAELRSQGVIRWAGAGMNGTEMLTRFVRETDMDVVLLAGRYTLLDQSALDDLLPACLDNGTLVVV